MSMSVGEIALLISLLNIVLNIFLFLRRSD